MIRSISRSRVGSVGFRFGHYFYVDVQLERKCARDCGHRLWITFNLHIVRQLGIVFCAHCRLDWNGVCCVAANNRQIVHAEERIFRSSQCGRWRWNRPRTEHISIATAIASFAAWRYRKKWSRQTIKPMVTFSNIRFSNGLPKLSAIIIERIESSIKYSNGI